MDEDYAKAVATYLGLIVDKAADFGSTLCHLNAEGGRGVTNTFGRQALPMVWDYAESNPFCEQGAGLLSYLSRTANALDALGFGIKTSVARRDARVTASNESGLVVTDPPYYDAINYADLSDFFYVWMKRSIGFLHPDLLSLPLTPKREQVVMNVYAANGARRGKTGGKKPGSGTWMAWHNPLWQWSSRWSPADLWALSSLTQTLMHGLLS